MFLQVIWAIGASMVCWRALQFLGRRVCLMLGALIVLGHNALDGVWPTRELLDASLPVWVALHAHVEDRRTIPLCSCIRCCPGSA